MIKLNAKYLGNKERLFEFTIQDCSDAKEYFSQLIHDGLVFRLTENPDENFFYGSTHKKDTADTIFKGGYQIGLEFQISIDSEHSDDLSIYIGNLGISKLLIKSLKSGIYIFQF